MQTNTWKLPSAPSDTDQIPPSLSITNKQRPINDLERKQRKEEGEAEQGRAASALAA